MFVCVLALLLLCRLCMVDGVCMNRVDLNAKVYGFDQAAPRPAGS